MSIQHVYLIPGFFGFSNFGRLVYFAHVRERLERKLGAMGVRAEIHRVRIPPTASLHRRAAELKAYIEATAPDSTAIHLVGHSTGGLDARLFTTPGVDVPGGQRPTDELARRVRSVISVVSPHYGTPLASFFTGFLGQRLLALLSLGTVAALRHGGLPLRLIARIAASLARLSVPGSKSELLLDELYHALLDEMPGDEREHMRDFLEQIGGDVSLMAQLMPEGIELFNGSAPMRDNVRYGCVVAHAARPTLAGRMRAGAGSYRQASYTLFSWLHPRAGDGADRWQPTLTAAQTAALESAYGELPAPDDNDGMVPVYSQVWGDVIHATRGDHLDVIGHFDGERLTPPHHDWLSTGTLFDAAAFDTLWDSVARFIAKG